MLIFSFFIQAAMQGNTSYGGVLMIGPIPIIFGSSPQMALASMLLAIVLMAISFLLVLPRKRSNGEDDANGYEIPEGPERPKRPEESERTEGSEKIKGGAVVMIGPIPLVIGSDPRTALLLMLFALAVMILWALVFKVG
jgi:uncharacterized protein (TIGR00304 family)